MDSAAYIAAAPLIAAAALLVYAAASDARRYLIPNWVSVALVLLFAPYALLSPAPADWQGGLIVAGIAFAVGLGLFSLRLVGGGDVKLIAACALWAGFGLVLPFLVITSLAGGALALGLMLARTLVAKRRGVPASAAEGGVIPVMRQRVPYGLAIAAGGIFILLRQLGALGLTF
ncbi:MAG: prepilin peptidase [Alphaproteobacteria bacterium]